MGNYHVDLAKNLAFSPTGLFEADVIGNPMFAARSLFRSLASDQSHSCMCSFVLVTVTLLHTQPSSKVRVALEP